MSFKELSCGLKYWTLSRPDFDIKVDQLSLDQSSSSSVLNNGFLDLETSLNKTKNLQNTPKNSPNNLWYTITRRFSPGFQTKKELESKFHFPSGVINNASLKLWELLELPGLSSQILKLQQQQQSSLDFIHFDNASFPGSWIIAFNYWYHVILSKKNVDVLLPFKWYGNSLLTSDDGKEDGILGDDLKLYRNFPHHWMMGHYFQTNGDVTSPGTFDILKEKFTTNDRGGKVHLYTSDLGFEPINFDKQEQEHLFANWGQILCGLLTLAPHGIFIIKQFTFFTSFNISLMAILSQCFHQPLYICKPIMSGADNSETYIVGIDFIPPCSELMEKLFQLFEQHYHQQKESKLSTLYPLGLLGSNFICNVYKIQAKLCELQERSLKAHINEFYEILSHPHRKNPLIDYVHKIHYNWLHYFRDRFQDYRAVPQLLLNTIHEDLYKRRNRKRNWDCTRLPTPPPVVIQNYPSSSLWEPQHEETGPPNKSPSRYMFRPDSPQGEEETVPNESPSRNRFQQEYQPHTPPYSPPPPPPPAEPYDPDQPFV